MCESRISRSPILFRVSKRSLLNRIKGSLFSAHYWVLVLFLIFTFRSRPALSLNCPWPPMNKPRVQQLTEHIKSVMFIHDFCRRAPRRGPKPGRSRAESRNIQNNFSFKTTLLRKVCKKCVELFCDMWSKNVLSKNCNIYKTTQFSNNFH